MNRYHESGGQGEEKRSRRKDEIEKLERNPGRWRKEGKAWVQFPVLGVSPALLLSPCRYDAQVERRDNAFTHYTEAVKNGRVGRQTAPLRSHTSVPLYQRRLSRLLCMRVHNWVDCRTRELGAKRGCVHGRKTLYRAL